MPNETSQKRTFAGLPLLGNTGSKRPLKVCIASREFVGPIRNGGIGTAYTAMGHALAAAGHQVTLFYTQGRKCENGTIAHWEDVYRKQNLQFVARPSDPKLRIDSPPHVVSSYETYRWLKTQQFDLVHFPEWGADAYYSLLAKHQGIAFAATLFCIGTHSPTAWLKEANSEFYSQPQEIELDFMERRCIALADFVIAPCQYMLEWMLEHGFALPAQSFVQQNILPASARRNAPAGSGSQPVSEIVFFGRLETRKGIELFSNALDRLTQAPEFRNVKVTFLGKIATVGGRDSRAYIKNRSANWPWSWSIVSNLDQPGAMRYLQQPGCLAIIPSLIENSPYTVLECLGSEVPFLASRVGGIPELIASEDLESATFFPRADTLANLLKQTLQSGKRTWKPAMDANANEAAWVAWHNGLPAQTSRTPSCGTIAPLEDAPLVSVCVAHFNRPQMLRQALASLEAQDYSNFEVIVVDDGSTSAVAIEYLENLEPRLQQRNWRLIRQENRYLSAARNAGARHARGQFLLFMDDDNFAKPEEISTFVNVALRTGADIVTSCMDYFEGNQPPAANPKGVTRWVPLGAAAAAGFFRNVFGDANCLVRKRVFDKLGGFTEIHGVTHEDWEFLAGAVLKDAHLEVIPEALFHYRYTPNSMIRSTSRFRNHQRHIRPYLDLVPPALHQIFLVAQGSWIEQTQGRGMLFAHSQHMLKWRSEFEAARALVKLGHKSSAQELLISALKSAQASNHPVLIFEAMLEIGRELNVLDAGRAREILQLALQLAEASKSADAIGAAKAALAEIRSRSAPFNGDGPCAANLLSASDSKTSNDTHETRRPAPCVSVVIPTFNNLAMTRACLKALHANTPPCEFEIIVVDNDSADGTRAFLENEHRAGRLTAVLNDKNFGFARACNQGAAAARGKYVLFLNNDTEVRPGWLEPLKRAADADPRIGALGSKLLFPDGTIQHAGVIILDARAHGDPLLAQHVFQRQPSNLLDANKPRTYQALTAACMFVPRETFRQVGGFDEEFWNGYEDVDLCFRIRKTGKLLVYQPASVVTHCESQSGPERFRLAQQNIARLHGKWLGKIRPDFVLETNGETTRTNAGCISDYTAPGEAVGAEVCVTSIVILALNQLEHTRRCLESLDAHTNLPHQIIVVDNGSTDGTPQFLSQWRAERPNRIVIRNETNRGFAAGNNQGLAIALGDHVVLLNNDTVVTKGWLGRMKQVLEEHSGTGVVGPVSNNVSGPQQVREADYESLAELPAFADKWSQEHAGQSFEINRVVGFCLLARREVIEKIGGLDERFSSGNFEDDDFCIRARLAGFKVRVAQDVFIHHTGGQTFKGARIDYRQAMLRNWDLFRAKWRLPAGASLERGYPIPTNKPAEVSLHIALPSLNLTHKSDGETVWIEEVPVQTAKKTEAPPVARLGNLDKARSLFGQRQFESAWRDVVAALSARPFHPEAYLLLAVIALAAGDGNGARQCAQQARDFAPGWKAPKQFLQKPLKGNSRPEWLILPDVIQGPKSKVQSLSVCLIVKNEEKFLGQCLESVRGLASQIVLVDTGSTDRTVEIAKQHRAEVYHTAWTDDFSAARNTALEHATGDWVLMLDADEELPADQHGKLRDDLKQTDAVALRLPLVNRGEKGQGYSYVPRLFRNLPGAYYYGRIHEQIFPSLIAASKGWGMATRFGTAQILHHGYAGEVVKDRNKIERNLHLLRQAVEEYPDDANLAMNLGLELVHSGDLATGLKHYRKAFRLMSAQLPGGVVPELREVLLTQLTCHLYQVRAHDEIVQTLNSPLAKHGGLTASLHFALALAYFELKQFRKAVEHLRHCLAKRGQPTFAPLNADILTAAPHHCLAVSLARLGDNAEAEKSFQAGLEEKSRVEELRLAYAKFLTEQNRPVEALHQLHEIVRHQPQHAPAWRLGGEVALSKAEFLEFARDWTGEAIRNLPDDGVIVAQRAEVLLLSQDVSAALPLWTRTINGQRPPQAVAARIICATIGAQPVEGLRDQAEETAVSHAFVNWYRRLVTVGARDAVFRLNSQVETLRPVLPSAATVLDGVIADIRKTEAAQPVAS
jgi:GT2 family glycosyltransferase/tetratricopeptide (TPR) repeat protein/glycosyltransferase involved in cell wall biosynthesis